MEGVCGCPKIINEGFFKQDFAEFCYFDVITYLEMFFSTILAYF